MREGWVRGDYIVLFEGNELETVSASYAFTELMSGYRLLGLRSWDEFIVADHAGQAFTVPTVPVGGDHLTPFQLPDVDSVWEEDERLKGKISGI